jgi:hypothetical protein
MNGADGAGGTAVQADSSATARMSGILRRWGGVYLVVSDSVIGRRHDFREEIRLDASKVEHYFGSRCDPDGINVE